MPINSNDHLNRVVRVFAALLFFFSYVTLANVDENSDTFSQARQLLKEAHQSETTSNQMILDANKSRKDINRLRAKARSVKDSKDKKRYTAEADTLAGSLRGAQKKGSELRDKSKANYQRALHLFEQGLVEKWGKRIANRKPMAVDNATMMFIAHNTRFRSVHPNMLNRMGTPTDNIDPNKINKDMSILVPALAGQNAPPDLDVSSFQLSRMQNYLAHIEVKPGGGEDMDKDELIPLNTIHKWKLLLTDLSGNPIEGARIELEGHMPGHVHGLPTQPRVTKEMAPGLYQVEGLKFQMKGWWVMQFNIDRQTAQGNDSVVFNLVL